MFWIPMAIGAGVGALTNKDNPLKGAAVGAALGGVTGGLGGLGGAAPAAGTGLQAGGAAMSGAPGLSMGATGTGLLSGGGQGLSMAAGAGTQLSAASSPAASGGLFGLLNKDNLQTASNVAGLAGQMGIFDDPQAPQATSAGIPARQTDFSGLLRSQGQSNNAAGAQRLLQQQMARKQGRL